MTNVTNYKQFLEIKHEIEEKNLYFIKIITDSMMPLLKINSVYTVTAAEISTLKRFDVILFWYRGKPTAHFYWGPNLLSKDKSFVTKSLKEAKQSDDPTDNSLFLGQVNIKVGLVHKLIFALRYFF